MNKEEHIDMITELLIDFDEMGFAPTTTCPNAEEYAIKWRNDITKLIEEDRTNLAKQILQEVDDKLNELALDYYNAGKPTYYCVCEVIHHKVISKILKKYTGEQTNA